MTTLDLAEARARFRSSPVAVLSTADVSGRPHVVPVVFALSGDSLWTAVDHKPKSSRHLRRLRNIRANPAVSLLVHHYADDWTSLWWVRADGQAVVLDEPAAMAAPIDHLVAKYPQYQAIRPAGPVIEVTVTHWTGWAA
jgi:PPOX class probable F420-dependent enzyme